MTPVPVGHISAGRTVTFIQTTAGITGTFDSINDDYALLNFSSAVDGNDYELTIDKLTYDTAASSGNQLSLSQVLNALNTSDDADVQAFLYQIDLLSASGIGAGYNALVPSLSLNMDLIARSNSALFFDQISRYAFSDYKADDQDVYAYIMGALGSLSNTGGNLGAAWETYGIGAGKNIFTSGEAAIGIAGGGVWSDADGNDSIGSGTMKGVQTALYGRTGGDLGWGNLLLGYGRNWNKTARPIGFLGAAADSTWESDVYSVSLAGGWNMASDGPVKFQPTAALNYTRVNAESYFETGAGRANLSVDSGAYESLRHEAGVRAVCRAWENNEKGIQSDFKLLWVHEYADRDSTRTVSLAGERFQGSSARPSRDSLAAGVGLAFAMPGGMTGRLAYDSELSRDMTVQSLSLDIKIKF